MPALGQKSLLEACRALGEGVAGQPVLPPLIREAGEVEGSGGAVHYAAIGDGWLRFEARFDKAYVNRHEFPLKRLPLLIDCALCDGERRPLATALDEEEKFALICAFFLAAQTPIGVEPIENTGDYRLSLRLSPTFVVEWREPFESDALESCETLCRRVASSLWDKSREFFASERLGMAVWSLRAAQELLGAPKLAPKALEDFISLSLADGREPRSETLVAPLPQTRAEAMALMLSPRPEPAPIEASASAPLVASEGAGPALATDQKVALGGRAWRGAAAGLFAAVIPLTLMVSVGAFMSFYRKAEAEAPRVEARDAQGPALPAAVAATPTAAVAATTAKDAVASIEPPHVDNASPVVSQSQPESEAAAKPTAAAPTPPSKPAARRPGHGTAKSRHSRDPFAAVGRAVNRFTSDVWSGLSSIPKHFGGNSYY